jgi:hypothetical protein
VDYAQRQSPAAALRERKRLPWEERAMSMYAPAGMTQPPPPHPPDIDIDLLRDALHEPRNGLPGYTFGRLFLNGLKSDHVCETYEGHDRRLEELKTMRESVVNTAIPCGRWRVTVHNSRHNGRVIAVHCVPGFKGVEILKERSHDIMPGAIIVGEHRHLAGVSMSVLSHNRLVAYVANKERAGHRVFLKVSRAV